MRVRARWQYQSIAYCVLHTVGEPRRFADWLQGLSTKRGHGFTFIQHTNRYNALRKAVYSCKDPPSFSSLQEAVQAFDNTISFLHPIAACTTNAGLPEDLALEASDCLSLAQALEAAAPASFPQELTTAQFFKDTPVLKMIDVLEYERQLKTLLDQWLSYPHQDRRAQAVSAVFTQFRDTVEPAYVETDMKKADPKHLMHLLHTLTSNGQLPGILFAFDRRAVETGARAVFDMLVETEAVYKKGSKVWQKKLSDFAAWRAQARVRAQQAERDARNNKNRKVGDTQDSATSVWESFDPDEPLPAFSFLDQRKTSYAGIQSIIADQRYIRQKVPEWLLAALERGIAVHHAGLNKAYRLLVETLFRQGSIRVVFATGTLAQGLNMPAKTCVFYGDNIFLTALQYRYVLRLAALVL